MKKLTLKDTWVFIVAIIGIISISLYNLSTPDYDSCLMEFHGVITDIDYTGHQSLTIKIEEKEYKLWSWSRLDRRNNWTVGDSTSKERCSRILYHYVLNEDREYILKDSFMLSLSVDCDQCP